MRAPLAFRKYEGLGNDFIVVEPLDLLVTPADASELCDRHFGVGADGVLFVVPPSVSEADAKMVVINSDGSRPEMCGNGVRCIAVYLARAKGVRSGVIRVETGAGVRVCAVEDSHGEGMVTVDMGIVSVGKERELEVDGERLRVTLADVGNPHAVAFGAFDRGDVQRLGSRVAVHPDFPDGINVGFARTRGDGIDLVVWERGAGITLACGTGACAAAAVACAKGYAAYETPIAVRLPGGQLQVTVHRDGHTALRGPARHVFSGTIDVSAKSGNA